MRNRSGGEGLGEVERIGGKGKYNWYIIYVRKIS